MANTEVPAGFEPVGQEEDVPHGFERVDQTQTATEEIPAGFEAVASTPEPVEQQQEEFVPQGFHPLAPEERISWLKQRMDSGEVGDALAPDELDEVLNHMTSGQDWKGMTVGKAARSAASGLGHVIKSMLIDIPVEATKGMNSKLRSSLQTYVDNGEDLSTAVPKALWDTIGQGATSFTSGYGLAAADTLRQVGKLTGSVAENVLGGWEQMSKDPETGKLKFEKVGGVDANAATPWNTTDAGDQLLFQRGLLTKEQFRERYLARHNADKALAVVRQETPNIVQFGAAKTFSDAAEAMYGEGAGMTPEEIEAQGADANKGFAQAGEFAGFGKVMEAPTAAITGALRVTNKALTAPIKRFTENKAVAPVAGFVSETAGKLGKSLDNYADTLAARGSISKPAAEAFKSGGSIIKEGVIGTAGLWLGGTIGNLFGSPEVGALLGGAFTLKSRAGDIAGIARKGLQTVENTAGLTDYMIKVMNEYRGKASTVDKVLKETEAQTGVLAARLEATRRESAKFAEGTLQWKDNQRSQYNLTRQIETLQQRARDMRLSAQLIREGLHGKTLFGELAARGKQGVQVTENGVTRTVPVPKEIIRLAERLDNKPTQWLLQRAIPTAKSAIALGVANMIISTGADLPPEQLAESFGMGGLALMGMFGRGSVHAPQEKLADAGRGFAAMYESLFNQILEEPNIKAIPDEVARTNEASETAKARMLQMLSLAYDPKRAMNMLDHYRATRDSFDFTILDQTLTEKQKAEQGLEGKAGGFYPPTAERPRGLLQIDLDSQRAADSGVENVYFHEAGHDLFDWASKNEPALLNEFKRSVYAHTTEAQRQTAIWRYAINLAFPKIANIISGELQAEGLRPEQINVELVKLNREMKSAKPGEGPYADMVKAELERTNDKGEKIYNDGYWLNEAMADIHTVVGQTRDFSQLAEGKTGARKNAQGVTDRVSTSGMGLSAELNAILANSETRNLAERLSSTYLNAKGQLTPKNKRARRQREKGVQVPVSFGKDNALGSIENEAVQRAKADEKNGFNPQVDTHALPDYRGDFMPRDGERMIVDAEWGRVFENGATGELRVTREKPQNIVKRVRERQLKVRAIRDRTKSTMDKDGWGWGVDEAGRETFGGSTPPPRFHYTLKTAGYKPEQVNAVWNWMKALKNPGTALNLWNFGFGTSLNKGSWDALIKSQKGGMTRTQRTVVPIGIKLSKKGEVLLEGFDLTVLNLRIEEFAEDNRLRPWNGDIEAFKTDLEQVLYNWNRNRPGESPIKIAGEKRQRLTTEQKDIINAVIMGKGPKSKTGKNPYRDQLSGDASRGVIRSYRLDNVENVREAGIADAYYDYTKAKENRLPDEPKTTAAGRPQDFQLEQEEAYPGEASIGRSTDGLPGRSVFDFVEGTEGLRRTLQGVNQRAATTALENFALERIGKPQSSGTGGAAEGSGGTGNARGSSNASSGKGTLWSAILNRTGFGGQGFIQGLAGRLGFGGEGGGLSGRDRTRALEAVQEFFAKDPRSYNESDKAFAQDFCSSVPRLTFEDVHAQIDWNHLANTIRDWHGGQKIESRPTQPKKLMENAHALQHIASMMGIQLYGDPAKIVGDLFLEVRKKAIEQEPGGQRWQYIAAGTEGIVFRSGRDVYKIQPFRTSIEGQPLTGGVAISKIKASKNPVTRKEAVGMMGTWGDFFDALNTYTTMPHLPGVEPVEVRGVIAPGGHLVVRQRFVDPVEDFTVRHKDRWIEQQPNVVKISSVPLSFSIVQDKVLTNQLLMAGDDGRLYIVADVRGPNVGQRADQSIRLTDPVIKQVTNTDLQTIPELKGAARRLFAKMHGEIGRSLYRDMVGTAMRTKVELPITIPVGSEYHALPDTAIHNLETMDDTYTYGRGYKNPVQGRFYSTAARAINAAIAVHGLKNVTGEMLKDAIIKGVRDKSGNLIAAPAKPSELKATRDIMGVSLEEYLRDHPDAKVRDIEDFVLYNKIKLAVRNRQDSRPKSLNEALQGVSAMRKSMAQEAPYGTPESPLMKRMGRFHAYLEELLGSVPSSIYKEPNTAFENYTEMGPALGYHETDIHITSDMPTRDSGERNYNPPVSHVSPRNTIAKVRWTTRVDQDGHPYIFIEELQSDWMNAIASNEKHNYGRDIPAQPFNNKWVDVAMKAMISEAVERGIDRIAFATGDMVSTRWNGKFKGTNLYDRVIPNVLKDLLKITPEEIDLVRAQSADEAKHLDRYIDNLDTANKLLSEGALIRGQWRSRFRVKGGEPISGIDIELSKPSELAAMIEEHGNPSSLTLVHMPNAKVQSFRIRQETADRVSSGPVPAFLPDKFWLDPEGKVVEVGGLGADHTEAAAKILKSKHKDVPFDDEFDNPFTELVKLGYRRGVYDRSQKTVYVNDHGPFRVNPKQYETLRQLAVNNLWDVINENAVTNQVKRIFDYKDPGQGAWLPDSPEFAGWWQNSKIVDEQGNPKLVYHGTPYIFDTFSRGDVGYHFGTQEQATNRLTRYRTGHTPNIIAAYLSIQNPMRIVTDPGAWREGLVRAMHQTGIIEKPDMDMLYAKMRGLTDGEKEQFMRNYIASLGYDGIIYPNYAEGKGDSYVAFYPWQIKSPDSKFNRFDDRFNALPDRIKQVEEGEPMSGFESKLLTALGTKVKGRMTKKQLVATLKGQGVKDGEIEWHLGAALRSKKDDEFFSPGELRDIVDSTRLDVEEAVHSADRMADLTDAQIAKDSAKSNLVHRHGLYIRRDSADPRIPVEIRNRRGDVITEFTPDQQALIDEYNRAHEAIFKAHFSNPKWEKYTIEGGDNYRELLIKLPKREYGALPQGFFVARIDEDLKPSSWYHIWKKDDDGLNVYIGVTGTRTEAEAIQQFYAQHATSQGIPAVTLNQQNPTHYPEHNVIVSVRTKDREINGKKVLYIEEIQSDWHQKGTNTRYYTQEMAEQYTQAEKELRDVVAAIFDARYPDRVSFEPAAKEETLIDAYGSLPEAQQKALSQAADKVEALRPKSGDVPDAPFKGDSWIQLAIKRLIKQAVDEGYDAVALSPGEVHAQRWNLSTHVDRLRVQREGSRYYVEVIRPGEASYTPASDSMIPQDRLAEYIGEEMAQKAIADTAGNELGVAVYNKDQLSNMETLGKKMIRRYNELYPRVFNKVLKPYGAKMEKMDVVGEKGERYPAWAIYGDEGAYVVYDDALSPVKKFKTFDAAERYLLSHMEELGLSPVPDETISSLGFKVTEKMRSEIGDAQKPQPLWLPDDPSITAEATPSTSIASLDPAGKQEVTDVVLSKIANGTRLNFLDKLGIDHEITRGTGSWEGSESPNLIISVKTPFQIAKRISAFIGDALNQDAVFTIQPNPNGKQAGVVIDWKDNIDPGTVRDALKGYNFTEDTGNGWIIIPDDSSSRRMLKAFAGEVQKAVEPLGLNAKLFRTEAEMEDKNTYARTIAKTANDPRRLGITRPLDILQLAKDSLYLPAEEGFREFFTTRGIWPSTSLAAAKHGWDTAERGPRNPEQPNPNALRGWRHYGAEGLELINPDFHGTGKVGAERERKRDYPDLYVPRTYVGLEGYEREQGLPRNEYRGQVDTRLLYNVQLDPLNLYSEALKDMRESGEYGLMDDAAALTIMERKIRDAGFAGYRHNNVAALFYPLRPGEMLDYEAYKKTHPRDARRAKRVLVQMDKKQ